MRLILLIALALPALAQVRFPGVTIYPSSNDVSTGQLQFLTRRSDGNSVQIQAPTTGTSYTLTLPTAVAANNGDCLVSTTAGVLSFATCSGSGGIWTASGGDVYRATGRVTVGSATADSTLSVVTSTDSGITVSDGTTRGVVFPSSAATNSLVIGTTTNHPVILFANNAEAFRVSPGGALLTRSHITTVSPSAADIGDATNYFQTLYVENIDATVGSVSNQYIKTRKLEVADIAGSGGFWDHRSQGSFVSNSSYTIRDNGGSRWLQAYRAISGSPLNYTSVFTDWVPALRATGDGDASSDSTLPALGATGSRWSTAFINLLDVTESLTLLPSGTASLGASGDDWNRLWVGGVEATSFVRPQVDNGGTNGSSGKRWSATYTVNLEADGTVKLGTSSTVGYVWTATDTAGNGGWALPGSSPWTTSGSDIYYSSGKVTVGSATPDALLGIRGSINDGLSVTDGTARGIFFASSVGTNSIVAGTTSAHPFVLFGHNGERARLTSSGMTVTGTLDVSGNATVTGAVNANGGIQLTGSINSVTSTELGYVAGVTSSIQTQLTARLPLAGGTMTGSILTSGTNALGASGADWNRLWVGGVEATSFVRPQVDNGGTSGTSGRRWSSTYTVNLEADGTVKLGTSSTVGYVWTATDTAGNGGWAAAPGGVATSRLISTSSPLSGGGDLSADRTLSCPTCFTTSGGTINGGTNAGVTVTDGTATGILFASSVATNSIVAGTTSAHPFVLFGHNGERARLTATGMTVTGTLDVSGAATVTGIVNANGGIQLTGSLNSVTSTEIGYVSGVTSSIQTQLTARLPLAGGTMTGSILTSGTNALGASGADWNRLWVGGVEATSFVRPQVDNGGTSGTSGRRWGATYTVNLEADGTVKLGTSSTVGYVWTATDTAGNGGWAIPASSQWTTSGSNIYYSTGKVTVGSATPDALLGVRSSINDGISITDGTARGIMFASAALTNSIVFGTTSAHPLAVFSGNSQHSVFWPSGNSCVGCSNDTYKWEVNGTLRAAGATTLSSTLDVTGITTLSSNLVVNGTTKLGTSSTAFQVWTASDSSGNGGWADIGPCATCVTTAANNVSIAGTKTFTGVLTGTGGASISGGNTTVEGIRFASASTHTIGTSSVRPSNTFTDSLQIYSSAELKSGATFTFLGDLVANSLTLTPTELGYLDGVTSNIQTQINAKGAGTVTSIATTSPISGGTITSSGTISCPTCYTTAGGTISGAVQVAGSLTPLSGSTYAFGSTFLRWTTLWAQTLNISSGTVAPDGNTGISATVTVRNSAGTGTCTLVFSGGLLTGGTC